ncbi:MAG: hypothetical protein IH840_15520, partial [Candidatus Heimdallarchaeota archaeon]|nr:hypothetical protein [Candidatus Heimdallarchaeota archaeon]
MLIPVQLGWSISSFYFILITLGYIVLSEISHIKSKLIWLAISLMHINYGIHLIWGDKPDLRENEGYVFLVVLAILPIYLLYLAYSDKQMDELSRRDNQISGVLLSIYSIFILAFMQFLGLDLKFSIYYTIMLSVFLFILYTAHSEKPYDGISIVILLTVIGFVSQLYDNINIAYKLLPFFIGAIFLIYSSVVSEKADHNFGALISIAFIFNFTFNFLRDPEFGSDTVRGVGIDLILAVLLTGSYIFHHFKHNSPITEIAAGITVIIGALTLGNAPGFLAAGKIFPLIFVFQIAKSYWIDRRSEDVDLKEEIAAKFGLTVIYFFFVNFEFEQELFYILVIGLGALMMDYVRVRSSSDHFSFSLSYIWLLFGSWFLRGFEVQKPEFIAISLLIGPIVMLLAHQAKVSGNADWFNYALLTSLITFAFATIGYSDSNNDLLAFTTLLLLLPLTYIIWTSNDENVVNYSIVSLAIVATVIPTESAYLAVLTIFVNISYTLINSFLKTTKTFSSHSSLFGPVAIWLGALLGTDWVYSATKIDLFWKQLAGQEALLDYLWITMYFMGFIAISRDYLQRSKESSDEEAPIYSNPLFYLWLLLTSWVLRNPSGNDHAFIALSILIGPCLLFLAETTKNTGKSDWYVGGLITALVVFSFGRFDRGYTDPRDLMFSTIILLVTLTYIIWTSKDDRIINLSIASLGVLAIVLPPESAILVVFTVFANISYMFLKSFLESDDVPTSRSYLFGALILWLGRVLGESEKVWTYVDDQPDSPLNFLWITMFLFWLVAANLEISTTGTIFIKFESEGDERADVILKGKIDSLSFTWVSFAVISILWADLVEEALDVIVLTIVIAAIISLAVFLFDQNLKLETSFSYHLLIGSYILFSMVGWNLIRKLSDTSSWANALESMNIGRSSFHHIHSVFTLLPLSIAVFLILYRSRIDFPISDPQTLPVGLILATWGPLIAGWRYTKSFESDFTPILFVNLILTFAYLILGSRKNNPLTTSIATIMIYVQVFMLGSSLGLAFVDIDVSVYFVLL